MKYQMESIIINYLRKVHNQIQNILRQYQKVKIIQVLLAHNCHLRMGMEKRIQLPVQKIVFHLIHQGLQVIQRKKTARVTEKVTIKGKGLDHCQGRDPPQPLPKRVVLNPRNIVREMFQSLDHDPVLCQHLDQGLGLATELGVPKQNLDQDLGLNLDLDHLCQNRMQINLNLLSCLHHLLNHIIVTVYLVLTVESQMIVKMINLRIKVPQRQLYPLLLGYIN